jgi:dipeptidyl aminopeptidase/acylaminoacyl peptidase
MAWGPGGIAVAVGSTGRYGLVVYRPGKRPQVIALGSAVLRVLEWQPAGRLLAFGDFIPGDQVAEVRLFDPVTGTITQVAAASNYGQFKWSPDGRVLAVVRADYIIAFVDPQGRTLTTRSIRGIPDDWAP